MPRLARGVLSVLLLCVLVSPGSVLGAKKMLMQPSLNPTQTDLEVSIAISGRVFEPNNASVSNAVISIQVKNPQGTSIHVATAYTNSHGVFQDSFLIARDSPAGNYRAFLVADKPGYDTVRETLVFAYGTPDFDIGTTPSNEMTPLLLEYEWILVVVIVPLFLWVLWRSYRTQSEKKRKKNALIKALSSRLGDCSR